MKTIRPFNNIATVVHVPELPPIKNPSFMFGFNIGMRGANGTIRLTVKFMLNNIHVATYESHYELQGEGLILEDHIHACCQQAIYAMQMFLQYDKIAKTIPKDLFQCPGKEAFEDDLTDVAKGLNALEGKRGFPPPPPKRK